MKTLKERTEAAIAAGFSVGQLAIAAKRTSSAVSQWRSGDVKSLKAESAAGLAHLTGWSQSWWATGEGPQISENMSHAVRPYSVKKQNVAPVFEWALLGDVLFVESKDLSSVEYLSTLDIDDPLVKWFIVDEHMPRLRLKRGVRVLIQPTEDASRCEDDELCIFQTASGAFVLGDFRRLADGFEAIPDSGPPMDSQRHGIKLVGRVKGSIMPIDNRRRHGNS